MASATVTYARRMRRRIIQALRRLGFRQNGFLVLLAVVTGVGTAVGAVAFAKLLEWTIRFCYEHVGGAAQVSQVGWGLLLLPLLPASGGLLVGLITHRFAREAKGHGVPEVMDAIARKGGVIRPRVSVAKAVASALTIGSGGSAGTEGPIVQIGAALGSSMGQVFRLPRGQLPVLIACGAAAGISSIFNAPIAGVLFALEIFLYDFSFRAFTPVVLSSVLSATVTHALLGADKAMLALPKEIRYHFDWPELGNFVVLGVLAGLVAVLYIRSLSATETLFDGRLKRLLHPILRPVVGGLMLGVVGMVLVLLGAAVEGQPAVFGNGYPYIHKLLNPAYYDGQHVKLIAGALVLLMAAKLLGTCLTLGSGGSGGVFAPSLFMGAALGGLLGLVLRHVFGFAAVDPVSYAVVGMAAVFAGSTHAFMTGIVMLFEMTQDYRVMLPIMLAATIATAVSQILNRDSIYTEKLAHRGVRMGMVADITLLRRISVAELPLTPATVVHEDAPLSELISRAAAGPTADFVVTDDLDHYRGMVVAEDLRVALLEREAVPLLLVKELLRRDIPTVRRFDSLADVFDRFSRHDVAALPVADPNDPDRIIGLVTRSALIRRYHLELSGTPGYGGPRRATREPPIPE